MGFGGGKPYNLTSTVTAGIVSAKARSWHKRNSILYSNRRSGKPRKQRRRSGNTRGDLIGINTMISMTGSYVGYSLLYRLIARKIIEDLMEYGNVQRAILGVEGGELNATASKAN
jgi:S1-C subfamily serine protease